MDLLNKQAILDYNVDETIFKKYMDKILPVIDANLDYYHDSFQHVSVGNKYPKGENVPWTASFFPGMALLAYHYTKDEKYLRLKDFYLDSFEERLVSGNTETHDLGFLYSLTGVALYKLTGDERAKEMAVKAADRLIDRYNDRGEYIQAWGPLNVRYPNVKIIIDCMMNLPLLYFATEVTGDEKYKEMAINHAITSSKTLVREDGSVYHTYLFDPISGRAIEGKTAQGKHDESTWARGQAWAVYGYTLSYMYTKKPLFLEVARKTAKYFIENLPQNFVHYWDFAVCDLNPEMKDTSANTIGSCGLLELSQFVEGEEKEIYQKIAKIMQQQVCELHYVETNAPGYGLVNESYYAAKCFNECSSWGDYFFVEAMCTLLEKEDRIIFW